MKEISLTQGKVALVDDEEFETLNKYKWWAGRSGERFYAARTTNSSEGKRRNIHMHRALLYLPPGMFVDHKDGNALNNQKNNLRICTKSQNGMNAGKRKDNTSGLKGVFWHRNAAKWMAQIVLNRKSIYLGIFADKNEAYKAYCVAAKELHGDFAHL